MLSPPKPLDEIQPNLVCELLQLMGRTTAIFFWPSPRGPGEGSKARISINLNSNINFKDVYTKLRMFPTNERYKTYQTGFHSVAWAMPQGWGWPYGPKNFKHGHVAYQIEKDDKQHRMQVNFSSKGSKW